MITAPLYPVSLILSGRSCLIAGFGKVGQRKLAGLMTASPERILILDPNPPLTEITHSLLQDERVKLEKRVCEPADIQNSFLVFAATNSYEENSRIAGLCKELHVLCNCATEPEEGDFSLPAVIRNNDVTATISTNGASPALSRIWKRELENWLKDKEKIAWLLARLREPIISLNLAQEDNAIIFRSLANSDIPHLLDAGKIDNCRQWLKSSLPAQLHKEIDIIIQEYANVFS